MFRNPILIILLLVIYTSPVNLIALSDDNTKPINIKADSAEINDATGISTYIGNVDVTQGSMRLTGDKVILKTENKKVKELIATGNLSTFQTTTDDGKTIHAEAKKMVYKITENEIVLTKQAILTESGNTFSSDRIVFYTDKEIVNAGSNTGEERVNITVFPETIESN